MSVHSDASNYFQLDGEWDDTLSLINEEFEPITNLLDLYPRKSPNYSDSPAFSYSTLANLKYVSSPSPSEDSLSRVDRCLSDVRESLDKAQRRSERVDCKGGGEPSSYPYDNNEDHQLNKSFDKFCDRSRLIHTTTNAAADEGMNGYWTSRARELRQSGGPPPGPVRRAEVFSDPALERKRDELWGRYIDTPHQSRPLVTGISRTPGWSKMESAYRAHARAYRNAGHVSNLWERYPHPVLPPHKRPPPPAPSAQRHLLSPRPNRAASGIRMIAAHLNTKPSLFLHQVSKPEEVRAGPIGARLGAYESEALPRYDNQQTTSSTMGSFSRVNCIPISETKRRIPRSISPCRPLTSSSKDGSEHIVNPTGGATQLAQSNNRTTRPQTSDPSLISFSKGYFDHFKESSTGGSEHTGNPTGGATQLAQYTNRANGPQSSDPSLTSFSKGYSDHFKESATEPITEQPSTDTAKNPPKKKSTPRVRVKKEKPSHERGRNNSNDVPIKMEEESAPLPQEKVYQMYDLTQKTQLATPFYINHSEFTTITKCSSSTTEMSSSIDSEVSPIADINNDLEAMIRAQLLEEFGDPSALSTKQGQIRKLTGLRDLMSTSLQLLNGCIKGTQNLSGV